MAGSGGPWGGGDGDDRGGRDDERGRGGPRRPGNDNPIPEIDQLVKKGQEQLRVLMGGKAKPGGGGGSGGGQGSSPLFTRQALAIGALAGIGLWAFMSFYTVRPEENSVEIFLGKFSGIGEPGLNFAPWPLVTAEIVQVTGERTTDVGTGRDDKPDSGLMLTRDQNIVDIGFQVVWNVSDPANYLFKLADPSDTVKAVSESAMRDIIARSELSPILNRDRGVIASDLLASVQQTLDSYEAGINVVRVNFEKADPPREVIDSFREVQAAQQERDRLEKEADAYANKVTAGARGEAARLVEAAEGYRAEVINAAQGEASRFLAVLGEYLKAPDVTRKRMYLETMEQVLGGMDKVVLDGVAGGAAGEGVVPFLPLTDLLRQGGAAAAPKGAGN